MSKKPKQTPFTIGLDYGSNSVRGIVVDLNNGKELSSATFNYPSGEKGILLSKSEVHLARQNPQDYLEGMDKVVTTLFNALKKLNLNPNDLLGIGIDTTGSTPLPVNEKNQALGNLPAFKKNLNAQAWLWKDHTGVNEALEITRLAKKARPEYLAKCGMTYSSEWFWSKILHCARVDQAVFKAAYSWVECCDWIPAELCGIDDPRNIKRSICAAGHKAMFHESWGGLPDESFLAQLHPGLVSLRSRLYSQAFPATELMGTISQKYLAKWKLNSDLKIPVTVGAFDAHLGAVGSGVEEGTLVKIIGTSTCDITTSQNKIEDIPGVCGIVPGSVTPGSYGIEAGQSAVGDLLNWYVEKVCLEKDHYHQTLTAEATKLKVGESGLLALDWNNGNRTVLVDANLTGLLLGQTLHTTRAEIYRALIEATAFGARRIIEQMEKYGVVINKVINCGGISQKNPLFMQIYADVIGKPMLVTEQLQTCALGSAMVAAVGSGYFKDIRGAQKKMLGTIKKTYQPKKIETKTYQQLYQIYLQLHDQFGKEDLSTSLYSVMKELLILKKSGRKNK